MHPSHPERCSDACAPLRALAAATALLPCRLSRLDVVGEFIFASVLDGAVERVSVGRGAWGEGSGAQGRTTRAACAL